MLIKLTFPWILEGERLTFPVICQGAGASPLAVDHKAVAGVASAQDWPSQVSPSPFVSMGTDRVLPPGHVCEPEGIHDLLKHHSICPHSHKRAGYHSQCP